MRAAIGHFYGLILAPMLAVVGCQSTGGSGALRVESQGAQAATLPSRFTTAVYSPSNLNIASFYLWDGDVEALLNGQPTNGQFVHVEILWEPRPGRTPIDDSTLNASVRQVIFVNGEFGVYGGAGLARLGDGVGSTQVSVSIPTASLTLLESSENFNDQLSPAHLTGGFTATLDERMSQRLMLAASQAVTNAAGRPFYVRLDRDDSMDAVRPAIVR